MTNHFVAFERRGDVIAACLLQKGGSKWCSRFHGPHARQRPHPRNRPGKGASVEGFGFLNQAAAATPRNCSFVFHMARRRTASLELSRRASSPPGSADRLRCYKNRTQGPVAGVVGNPGRTRGGSTGFGQVANPAKAKPEFLSPLPKLSGWVESLHRLHSKS